MQCECNGELKKENDAIVVNTKEETATSHEKFICTQCGRTIYKKKERDDK